MANFLADQNTVLFRFESGTYAVPSGLSGNWLGLVQSHEPEDSENVQEIRFVGTTNRNIGMFVQGTKDYTGTISFYPQDFKMLGFTLGSVLDVSGTTASVHRISELNSDGKSAYLAGSLNTYPSFTIHDFKKSSAGDGFQQTRQYIGCIVDSYNLKASEGNPIECEVSYKAQALTIGSKTTDIIPIKDQDTSRPYLWSDLLLHIPSGTAMNEVKEVSLTINNNLETRHYENGSLVAATHIPTNREYEVEVTMDANSTWGKTLYENYWQGGSTFNASLMISQNAATEYMFVTMSGCKMTAFSAPSPNEGVDEYNFTFKPQMIATVGSDQVSFYNFY